MCLKSSTFYYNFNKVLVNIAVVFYVFSVVYMYVYYRNNNSVVSRISEPHTSRLLALLTLSVPPS
jgi:hypothetical protein